MFGWDDALMIGGGLLMNRLGAGAAHGRMKQLQKQLMDLYSPGRLSSDTNMFFNQFKNSPVYNGLQRQAFSGSTELSGNLQRSFAERGLMGSGMAAGMLPMAKASIAPYMSQVDTSLYGHALDEAKSRRDSLAAILSGNQVPGIGAGTIGGFSEDFMPLLYQMLAKRWGLHNGQNAMPAGPR